VLDKNRGEMNERTSPESWLEDHGDALFAFAYVRLRDREAAEDLVQDTLLAAWRGRESFSASSSERTWLIGILKHKIADYWRRAERRPQIAQPRHADGEEGEDPLDQMFDTAHNGHWRTRPSPWENPHTALEQRQFWQILSDCVAALPAAQAQAFSLCELDGLKGDEVCKVLDVAPTNLWVMLHRARLRLRQCLENHWFGHQRKG
jgi:RNA polymerase sigma-70 factor, ECF subfamily